MWIRRLVFAFTALVLAAPSGRAGEQYALLVAVQDYPKTEFNPLQYTRNDILEFRQALLDSGFRDDHIIVLHDKQDKPELFPEIKKIRKNLDALLAIAGPDDTLIVAFSGHGVDKDKHSYFCPLDGELGDKTTLLDLDDLYAKLKDCRAQRKLLLADCCRNDPVSKLNKSVRPEVDIPSLSRPQNRDVPEGVVALFSCSAGETSREDPDLKHGVFFYHVIKGWRGEAADKDGKVTLDGVVAYAATETQTYVLKHYNAEVQRPHKQNDFSGEWVLNSNATAEKEETFDYTSDGQTKHGKRRVLTVDLGGGVTMEFVRIPHGTFMMGSPDSDKDAVDSEKPRHEVEITKDFYVGKYLVTQEQYKAVTGDSPSSFSASGRDKKAVDGLDTRRFPVDSVSWDDAQAFCKKLSAKVHRAAVLPTEAQWEYACRAGMETRFYSGDDLTSKDANVGDKLHRASAVGSYPANPWGLYDMEGNVAEWCADYYDLKYYGIADKKDPENTNKSGGRVVMRGCSWDGLPSQYRAARRTWRSPGDRYYYIGCRVALRLD